MPKHFIKTEDFTKEEYLEICRRAKIFQDGIEKGKTFTHLCSGKVLGSLFFQESTRTSTACQSAMIRLGGAYVGVSGMAGTYLASGEEDIGDFIESFVPFCDIVAIRHKTLNLGDIVPKMPIPVINAMCGNDEHSIGALAMVYSMYHRGFDFKKLKVGIYGMVKSSRPAKAMIKALGIMGATIYEDPVIEEFTTPADIRKFCEKAGGKIIRAKLDDFIGEVDVLDILEGLPQAGEDSALVEKYNKLFKVFTKEDIKRLKSTAVFRYIMPRQLTDGRLTATKDVDDSPRMIMKSFFKEWLYTVMALYTYLLDIEVK
jgi:aspartate carbamoyltransferase catalytic subunit